MLNRNNNASNLVNTYYSSDKDSTFSLIILCKTEYKPCALANKTYFSIVILR